MRNIPGKIETWSRYEAWSSSKFCSSGCLDADQAARLRVRCYYSGEGPGSLPGQNQCPRWSDPPGFPAMLHVPYSISPAVYPMEPGTSSRMILKLPTSGSNWKPVGWSTSIDRDNRAYSTGL